MATAKVRTATHAIWITPKKSGKPKKRSGEKATKLAADHVNITQKEVGRKSNRTLVTLIRTLAGSVLSQAEK